MTTLFLQSVGIAAPGLENWEEARKVLASEQGYERTEMQLTAPDILPATERRRSSDSVRLALRVAEQVLSPDETGQLKPAAIFSSAYGDPTITHKLCEFLSATPPMASPTLFHNSVHNAPAGYWSIATNNPNTTTSIAAGDQSFATGLLYAAAQVVSDQAPVLLLSYDLPYPHPLAERCAIDAPFASALLLQHQPSDNCIAKLVIETGSDAENQMENPQLETMRLGNPAARAIPLLSAIAKGEGLCALPYLADTQLQVEVTLCS